MNPISVAYPSPSNRYSRILPPFSYDLPDSEICAKLEQLAQSMLGIGSSSTGGTPVRAGYTYFGQFIFHDLTLDETPFRDAGKFDPDKIVNYRTPWLDLDSIYGDGPRSERHGHLYADDDASFIIGNATTAEGNFFDVPVHLGSRCVVDDRNLENAIIRQIHALFLLLHNRAVSELPLWVPAAKRFACARRRVCHQYQWLVTHDFLRAVCPAYILAAAARRELPAICWPTGRFSIPVEFSQAAARFGHSMVREEYRLQNSTTPHLLVKLFAPELRTRELPREFALGWHFFFAIELAMRIDSSAVLPLFCLPDDNIALYVKSTSPHAPHALVLRSLGRGVANRLPTGQLICRALTGNSAREEHCNIITSTSEILRSLDLQDATPLWYYLLLEAEIETQGTKLGTLGSQLVADVIAGALWYDEESFWRCCDPSWVPPAWASSAGAITVRNLEDVACVLGLERPDIS